MAESSFSRFYSRLTESIDQSVGWHKLPLPLGLLVLIGLRFRLRAKNLYDTYNKRLREPRATGKIEERYLTARTADGSYNDLDDPKMGSARTRFGRNVPLENAYPDESMVLTPNPRTVSQKLLTRDTFQPVSILNLLAAAWVQFMIHDWFSHGKNQKEMIPGTNIRCASYAHIRIQRARQIQMVYLPLTST